MGRSRGRRTPRGRSRHRRNLARHRGKLFIPLLILSLLFLIMSVILFGPMAFRHWAERQRFKGSVHSYDFYGAVQHVFQSSPEGGK